MRITDKNFFYTKVRIKYFNALELLKYKSQFNCNPKFNEIKIYLPNWLIEKTQPKSNKGGMIDFRFYIHYFPTLTEFLRQKATQTALENNYECILSEEDEFALEEIFTQDLIDVATTPIIGVSNRNQLDRNKVVGFIAYVILDLDRDEYPIDVINDYLDGKTNNVNEDLIKYKKTIPHLINWINSFASDNLKKEINLSVSEDEICFNIKSHFIREYINFLNNELFNLDCNANYTFINYKDNFDGKITTLDYANKRMANAFKELKNRKNANSLYFDSIEFKAYTRSQNDNSEIYGGMIVLKGLFDFQDADIYFIYKMRQKL